MQVRLYVLERMCVGQIFATRDYAFDDVCAPLREDTYHIYSALMNYLRISDESLHSIFLLAYILYSVEDYELCTRSEPL